MASQKELQAVFIDRDGTIGGTGHFIHPRDFQLFPFSLPAIGRLKDAGLKVFAFTNQHRIARGEATVGEFVAQFREFGFDQAYICPHSDADGCDCRKPQPGLLRKAAQEHELDLSRCAIIGDVGGTDMCAAAAVGAMKILVKTGWGEPSLTTYRHRWAGIEPDHIAINLHDAVNWILQ